MSTPPIDPAAWLRFHRDRLKIPPTVRQMLDSYCERHGIDQKQGMINQVPHLTKVLMDSGFELWPMFLHPTPTLEVHGDMVSITDFGRRLANSDKVPLSEEEQGIADSYDILEKKIEREMKRMRRFRR